MNSFKKIPPELTVVKRGYPKKPHRRATEFPTQREPKLDSFFFGFSPKWLVLLRAP